MNNRKNKFAVYSGILFETILIATAIMNILSKQWSNLYLLLVNAICIPVPFIIVYISNKKKIALPSGFILATLAFIFLTLYLGETIQFYIMFWWWDLFLHGLFGIYGVIIGIHLICGIAIKDDNVTKKRFAVYTLIFAFCFTITLGTLWELYEFSIDYFFKTNMTSGGLEDTATDLLIKNLCALITCITYYHYKYKNKIL